MENLHSVLWCIHYVYQQIQELCLNTTLFSTKKNRDSKNDSHISHSQASVSIRPPLQQTNHWKHLHFISSPFNAFKKLTQLGCAYREIKDELKAIGNFLRRFDEIAVQFEQLKLLCRCCYHLLTKARILVFAIYIYLFAFQIRQDVFTNKISITLLFIRAHASNDDGYANDKTAAAR